MANSLQELNKRQQQLEQAHAMLLRHHEKTQELEYRQQRAVHSLREDQVQRQHATELTNQQDYMQRAERDLRKKHALELKQQPKSLKVIKYFLWIARRNANSLIYHRFVIVTVNDGLKKILQNLIH